MSLPPQPEWRRLSARMLLIHPVREVGRFIPAIVGLLIAGRTTGFGPWWGLLGVVAVIALSIARWLTTRYRITPTQVELRTGLLTRRTKVAPADRVRTVDVTAPVLHRLLGLAKVDIGTGGGGHHGDTLVLDALAAGPAGLLRAELLHRSRTPAAAAPRATRGARPPRGRPPRRQGRWGPTRRAPLRRRPHVLPPGAPAPGALTPGVLTPDAPMPDAATATTSAGGVPPEHPDTELLRLDPRWTVYAPFTLSGVVTALAVAGVAWRLLDQLDLDATRLSAVQGVLGHLQRTPVWLDVAQALVVLVVVVTLLSVGGYVLSFWGYRLTRHLAGTLHVTRGLLTTRATSIEERRLRGVEIAEPVPLRWAGGRRLSAITTGLHSAERQRRRQRDAGAARPAGRGRAGGGTGAGRPVGAHGGAAPARCGGPPPAAGARDPAGRRRAGRGWRGPAARGPARLGACRSPPCHCCSPYRWGWTATAASGTPSAGTTW